MGVSIDKAQTMFSQGIQFQTSNGGVVYNDVSEAYIASSNPNSTPSYEQFQIVVIGSNLYVRNGTAIWAAHNFGKDADGNPTVSCGKQTLITTFTRYTGDSVVNGMTNGGFMQEDGYVILST